MTSNNEILRNTTVGYAKRRLGLILSINFVVLSLCWIFFIYPSIYNARSDRNPSTRNLQASGKVSAEVIVAIIAVVAPVTAVIAACGVYCIFYAPESHGDVVPLEILKKHLDLEAPERDGKELEDNRVEHFPDPEPDSSCDLGTTGVMTIQDI